MREDLKPVRWPIPPSIAGMDNESAREVIEDYIAGLEYSARENETRFKKAFRRINLCMSLHAILYPGNAKAIRERHFKWCPRPYWFEDY